MHALERNYDGIIIGAGHHGLVLGAYLAKAGLDILVVERRLDYGGGLSTKEATEPGFYHNLHSINHFHISETPWFKDLGLGERVTYITPRYEFGQAHSDGTALVLGRDLEETVANIARFSQKDAATFREWNRKGERITANIFLPERYSEPLPQTAREALLSRTMLGREFLAVTKRQPLDVVRELFENEHVRLLFLFKVSLFGTWLVDTLSTSPMGSVIRAFDLETGYQLCQGGSFNLARGLMEAFIAAGGTFASLGQGAPGWSYQYWASLSGFSFGPQSPCTFDFSRRSSTRSTRADFASTWSKPAAWAARRPEVSVWFV